MVERLRGELNGSGQLAGSLQQPTLNGQLLLTGGEIAGSELPTTFEDLRVRLLIEGERLSIDGGWRAGEQGAAASAVRWIGRTSWTRLAIKGGRLPVVVEPYADLEVEPDLRIVLSGQQLAVSGRVEVPRGAITVRELPPATVKVSEDTVIVGREAEEEATPLAVKMDIDVEVGQDRLRFSGFGLTADLAGYLHIGDNLDARGELQLKNGRYRAYGQRLTIRRAELLFTGLISQPFLNIEAIRRIEAENVVAGLRITGSAEQPRIDVFSEPAMSQEQALAILSWVGHWAPIPAITICWPRPRWGSARLAVHRSPADSRSARHPGLPARHRGNGRRHQCGRHWTAYRTSGVALRRGRVRTDQHHCPALSADPTYLFEAASGWPVRSTSSIAAISDRGTALVRGVRRRAPVRPLLAATAAPVRVSDHWRVHQTGLR